MSDPSNVDALRRELLATLRQRMQTPASDRRARDALRIRVDQLAAEIRETKDHDQRFAERTSASAGGAQ